MDDPKPTFKYLAERIKDLYPDFAYIHVVDPRAEGNRDRIPDPGEVGNIMARKTIAYCYNLQFQSNDFLRDVWKPKPFINAGGFNAELALESGEKTDDLVAFGRYYISNVGQHQYPYYYTTWADEIQPDIVLRLRAGFELAPTDKATWYRPMSPEGYVDIPFVVNVEEELRKWGLEA